MIVFGKGENLTRVDLGKIIPIDRKTVMGVLIFFSVVGLKSQRFKSVVVCVSVEQKVLQEY